MSLALKIGLVGLGKIAREQHLPAIEAMKNVKLVAIASRNARIDGLRNYSDLAAMLAGEPDIDAIIMCQPPAARFDAARMALSAGKHVFLEKPPGATVTEVDMLATLARQNRVTLFASWHSRFGAAVAPAKSWIALRRIDRVTVRWRENISQWHPGQDWILQAGGFGVFDPGINALSILTELLEGPIRICGAQFEVPENRCAPISARLQMMTTDGAAIESEFDFREVGPPVWEIEVVAARETLVLAQGGHQLMIDGIEQKLAKSEEYSLMYDHFATIIAAGRSDVDRMPLQLVADAFLSATVTSTAPFDF